MTREELTRSDLRKLLQALLGAFDSACDNEAMLDSIVARVNASGITGERLHQVLDMLQEHVAGELGLPSLH